MKHDDFSQRMKSYETFSRLRAKDKTPVVIRIDGKTFHTWTKFITKDNDPSLVKTPFSEKLHQCFKLTSIVLMQTIENAVLVYSSSDEISILLCDNITEKRQPWFGNKVLKMVSVSASIATATFNDAVRQRFGPEMPLAFFDSRVFNLPEKEVVNYFIWRQRETIRNSIHMYARRFFTQKELQYKKRNEIKEMLKNIGHPWDILPNWMKYGFCVHEGGYDENIPDFRDDRMYVASRMFSTERS